MYIADFYNNRIRKLTVSTGIITSIVGSSTSNSYSGDGGPATSATLYEPYGVTLDASGMVIKCTQRRLFLHLNFTLGNVYIADSGNNRIRKVMLSTGIITTIAGTGTASYSGDNGAATSATLYQPYEVALDTSGRIL